MLLVQEYFTLNVFVCSSFKITTIHHSQEVTADEANAGLCLLSDAEKQRFQKGSRGTFAMRFSKETCVPSSGILGSLTAVQGAEL